MQCKQNLMPVSLLVFDEDSFSRDFELTFMLSQFLPQVHEPVPELHKPLKEGETYPLFLDYQLIHHQIEPIPGKKTKKSKKKKDRNSEEEEEEDTFVHVAFRSTPFLTEQYIFSQSQEFLNNYSRLRSFEWYTSNLVLIYVGKDPFLFSQLEFLLRTSEALCPPTLLIIVDTEIIDMEFAKTSFAESHLGEKVSSAYF